MSQCPAPCHCSGCKKWLTVSAPPETKIVFCPTCFKCLQAPSDWDLGAPKAGDLLPTAPPAGQYEAEPTIKGSAGTVNAPSHWRPEKNLGPLLEVHGTPRSTTIGLVLLAVIFLAILPAGILLDYAGIIKQWPHDARLLAVGAPLCGTYLLYWGLRNLVFRQALLVFSEGLVRIRGKRVHEFRWDQLAGLFQKPSRTVVLKRLDGMTLTFVGLEPESAERLRQRSEREIWQRVYPRASQQYEQGDTVEFGRIAIGKEGLAVKGKTLPWRQIVSLCIDPHGNFTVSRKGGVLYWASVPVRSMPNFAVFEALAGRHVPIQRLARSE